MKSVTIELINGFMNVKMVSEGAKHVIENWNRMENDGKID